MYRNKILSLEESMIEFMDHAEYSKEDVQKCISTLMDFFNKIESINSRGNAKKFVEKVCTKLNQINAEANFSLIETDEREEIAEIINMLAFDLGFSKIGEDLTEEFREW